MNIQFKKSEKELLQKNGFVMAKNNSENTPIDVAEKIVENMVLEVGSEHTDTAESIITKITTHPDW